MHLKAITVVTTTCPVSAPAVRSAGLRPSGITPLSNFQRLAVFRGLVANFLENCNAGFHIYVCGGNLSSLAGPRYPGGLPLNDEINMRNPNWLRARPSRRGSRNTLMQRRLRPMPARAMWPAPVGLIVPSIGAAA